MVRYGDDLLDVVVGVHRFELGAELGLHPARDRRVRHQVPVFVPKRDEPGVAPHQSIERLRRERHVVDLRPKRGGHERVVVPAARTDDRRWADHQRCGRQVVGAGRFTNDLELGFVALPGIELRSARRERDVVPQVVIARDVRYLVGHLTERPKRAIDPLVFVADVARDNNDIGAAFVDGDRKLNHRFSVLCEIGVQVGDGSDSHDPLAMVLGPGVQVRVDDLRGLVAHRTIDSATTPGSSPTIAIDLQLNQPLPLSVSAQLDEEAARAAASPTPGVMAPLSIYVFGDRIRFELDAIQPGALRLETLVGALGAAGTRLQPGAAAAIILTVASLVSQLSDERGPRPHGELHQGAIFVSPGGAVAILGTGHPVLQAFLLPEAPASLAVPRAPERADDAPPTPTDDVYALAAIYAQLLTGQQATIPTSRALPDPRPGLVALLEACLSDDSARRPTDALTFAQWVHEELEGAGIALASASDLDEVLRTYIPDSLPTGDVSLLRAGADLEAREHHRGDPPAFVPALDRQDRPNVDPWASVLGANEAAASPGPKPPPVDDLVIRPATPRPGPSAGPFSPSGPVNPFQPGSRSAASQRASRSPTKLPQPRASSTQSSAVGPRLMIASPDLVSTGGAGRKANQDDPPGWPRVLLATAGAVAIGLGVMGALMSLRSNPPVVALPPPTDYGRTDAGPGGRAALPRVPTRRMIDSGVPKTAEVAQTGFLSVVSKPLGAQVELDGELLGTTPIVKRRTLPTTEYVLRVTKDGYVPWQQVVRPDSRGSLSVNAVLIPKS